MLVHSIHRMEKKIVREKVIKLMDWDKDSLMGKVKPVCGSKKAKKGITSPIDRQLFRHSQESQPPSRHSDLWKKMPSVQIFSPLSVFSTAFMAIWYGNVPLVAVSCPGCVPSLCISGLLAGSSVWESEKFLTLCKHWQAMIKTSLL